jgi:2-polyprenyl-3-methyl-5-hydroxy-6-metoxy-1,4-benzoquinol methylase
MTDMTKIVFSPLTNKDTVSLIKTWDTKKIIEAYKHNYNYDPSRFFSETNKIYQYKCNETGYVFFHPVIEGDSDFYSHFQQFDWYYNPWKWEHQQIVPLLTPGVSLLEIGCGKGDFISKIANKYGVETVGLELNQQAVRDAEKKGISILNLPLSELKKDHKNAFDIVCSFQVLEHVSDVRSFIEDSLECLKIGGYMIISVPNNKSFINEYVSPLNCPPHHVGWWDENSLSKLGQLFNIELCSIIYEPLQSYHQSWYKAIIRKKLIKNRYLRKLISLVFKSKFENIVDKLSDWAIGHTILGIYRKY